MIRNRPVISFPPFVPRIDALTGTAWATRAARFDHAQIRGHANLLQRDEELAGDGLTPVAIEEVRSHLFAYEALVRSHIDREEQLLLPILTDEVESAAQVPVVS
jgi:hemerythrin-like domain-containing protein